MNIHEIAQRVAMAEQAVQNFDSGKNGAIEKLEKETGLKVRGYTLEDGVCRIHTTFPTDNFKAAATKSQEGCINIA